MLCGRYDVGCTTHGCFDKHKICSEAGVLSLLVFTWLYIACSVFFFSEAWSHRVQGVHIQWQFEKECIIKLFLAIEKQSNSCCSSQPGNSCAGKSIPWSGSKAEIVNSELENWGVLVEGNSYQSNSYQRVKKKKVQARLHSLLVLAR